MRLEGDADSSRNTFHGYVSHKRLRFSRQRDIILDVFLSSEQHLSKDELFRVLRSRHKGISCSTVYRALKLFVKSGIAQEISLGDGQIRYQRVTGFGHNHLVCVRCKTVADFHSVVVEKLQREIAETFDFLVEPHKLMLYGVCSGCQQ